MSHDNYNLKFISDRILEIENDFDLLNWVVDGVLVWQSARARIYETIVNSYYTNNYCIKDRRVKKRYDIYSNIKRALITSTVLNPYLDFKKNNTIIIESSRKELIDGEFIDIYTKYLCDHLDNLNTKYTIYSIGLPLRKVKRSWTFNKSLDMVTLLSRTSSLFYSKKISSKHKSIISRVEKEFKSKINIEIDLLSIVRSELKRFKSNYLSYSLLFKIKQPHEIFLVGSSYKSALIKAAKDHGILVNELQHGLLTKESIIGNFPNSNEDSIEYFPDRFYIWKDLDMCNAKIPLSNSNILYFPNMHLNYVKKKYENKKRNQKQITVISQPYIGKQIFDYIISNIVKMSDWRIFYKLHPAEDIEDYEIPHNVKNQVDINLVSNEISVYELLVESNIVIGVFSTALFEAIYLGCKIILIELPGIEFTSHLSTQKNVIKIKLNDDLKEKLHLLNGN